MKKWDPTFGPSYTPMEMLDEGVFEGIYVHAIKNIPAKYKDHKNVVGKNEPDVSINKYGVKSRQSLKEWERKGWLTELSPLGWFEWYIKYFEGRRDADEDRMQIARWRSFVARHQGQINANCSLKNQKCRPKQRQGLLQWAWDSTTEFTDKRIKSNAERLAKASGVELGVLKVGHESISKSKTVIYLHDDGGFNLQDAIDTANEIGETLAIVGMTDTVSKINHIHYYPPCALEDLKSIANMYAVVYLAYHIRTNEQEELETMYDVVED